MIEYSHEEYEFVQKVMQLAAFDLAKVDPYVRSEVGKFVHSLSYEMLRRIIALMQYQYRSIPEEEDFCTALEVFTSHLVLGYTSGVLQDISLEESNVLDYTESDVVDSDEEDEDYNPEDDESSSCGDEDEEEEDDLEEDEEVDFRDEFEFENADGDEEDEDDEDDGEEDLTEESFSYYTAGSTQSLCRDFLNEVSVKHFRNELFGDNFESKCVVDLMCKLIVKELMLSTQGRMESLMTRAGYAPLQCLFAQRIQPKSSSSSSSAVVQTISKQQELLKEEQSQSADLIQTLKDLIQALKNEHTNQSDTAFRTSLQSPTPKQTQQPLTTDAAASSLSLDNMQTPNVSRDLIAVSPSTLQNIATQLKNTEERLTRIQTMLKSERKEKTALLDKDHKVKTLIDALKTISDEPVVPMQFASSKRFRAFEDVGDEVEESAPPKDPHLSTTPFDRMHRDVDAFQGDVDNSHVDRLVNFAAGEGDEVLRTVLSSSTGSSNQSNKRARISKPSELMEEPQYLLRPEHSSSAFSRWNRNQQGSLIAAAASSSRLVRDENQENLTPSLYHRHR